MDCSSGEGWVVAHLFCIPDPECEVVKCNETATPHRLCTRKINIFANFPSTDLQIDSPSLLSRGSSVERRQGHVKTHL